MGAAQRRDLGRKLDRRLLLTVLRIDYADVLCVCGTTISGGGEAADELAFGSCARGGIAGVSSGRRSTALPLTSAGGVVTGCVAAQAASVAASTMFAVPSRIG